MSEQYPPASTDRRADGPAAPNDDIEQAPAASEASAGDAPGEEQAWWEADGMPWKKEPGKADYWCLGWFGFIGVFSMALLPMRAWLLAVAPDWLAMVTGGRTAVAASGAIASTGDMPHWPIVLIVASILSLKFDWVYWWAGKLWGRGMIEVWSGQSKRAARGYARAERWAEKLGPIGFLIAYVPMPLPIMQVVFVMSGASNMSLRRFLIYDYIASTLWLVAFFLMGWQLGDAAVNVLNEYAKWAGYVAIGLIVFIIASTIVAQKRKAKGQLTD